MATIGSIMVAFEANLRGLEEGIEEALDLFDDLTEAVDDISEKLDGASEKTLKIKTSVDSSGVKKASRDVEDLEDEIEKSSPKVKVGLDTESLKSFANTSSAIAVEQIKEGFVELGKAAGAAAKAVGAATSAVGGVLDGTATSVDGVIKSVGRYQAAVGSLGAVAAAGGLGLGVFVKQLGGLSTIAEAASGSVGATTRIIGAAGGAFAAVAASVATFSAIMGIAKVAASGLSEESQKYVAEWVKGTATTASATAGLVAAAKTFKVVTTAVSEGKTVAEAFAAVFSATGSAVSRATGNIVSSVTAVGNVLAFAQVASGKFSASLSQMGGQAESVRNMAERFGSTAEQVQVLGFAAESAGVGMGQLAKAQQAFFTNVSKVKLGQLNTETTKEAKIAFDRLGVSVEDLRNKSPQEVFALVADKLDDVADAADRSAIAFDLFGKQGGNILPALRGLKDAADDAKRLGTVLSESDFKMFEGVDQSFDRLKNASSNLASTMLVSFAPIQAGWNNLMAELKGGLVAALGPIRSLMAAATVPFQVFMEVLGRVMNILLRMVGAVAKVVAAFADAPTIAVAFTAMGDAAKYFLGFVEQGVEFAENLANALYSELVPSIDQSASAMDKLVMGVAAFTTTVVAAGVGSAIMTTFGMTSSGALLKFAAALKAVNFAAFAGTLLKFLKLMTIGVAQTAASFVASFTIMTVSAIAGFVTPVLAGLASYITGVSAAAAATQVASVAMAAAWVVATAGLAAIVIAIVAVVQNFDKLKSFFANFGENVSKLFTLEGLADAASQVATAIKEAFLAVANYIGGFFGNLIANIMMRMKGIKPIEKIDAAQASVASVVQTRQANQQAAVQSGAAAATASAVGAGPGAGVAQQQEDVETLSSTLTQARQDFIALSLNAAKFGSAGKTAFLAAKQDFDKLQQSLAENKITAEQFEKELLRIQNNLQSNLKLADVLSPEDFQAAAEAMRKSVDDAFAQARQAMQGQDLGSSLSAENFFPASKEVKEAAKKFAEQYESEQINIQKRFQNGEFGEGESAKRRMQQESDASRRRFDANMSRIEVDKSFAAEIRKSLEDAFLSPIEKFEKRLKEIQGNKSLSAAEKSAATVAAQKEFVTQNFGKSAGDSIREKQAALTFATSKDEYGRTPMDSTRAAVEQNKLAIEKRQAAGLDATPVQQLQAGVDNINDVFGVAGKSLAEIQATLSPQEFADYQEAIKKNAEAVKASLGVEKTAAAQYAEQRDKINKAIADRVITEEEGAKALKEARDKMLAALGISKSPAEQFEDAVSKIQENAAELSPDEIAKGLKEAKDKLLSALGIDKSPAQAATESLKNLQEAFNKGQISAEEFAKGSQKAKDTLLQSLGIPLDPVTQLAERMGNLQEAFDAGLISSEEFAKGQEEAKRSMLPGGEAKSPVKQFQEDLSAVNRAVEAGLISEDEGADRKKNLQAQLQEDLKPALDNVAQDRRQIDSSDTRSKAGVDTFFRILRGNDNPSLKAQLEIARNTRLLAEAQQDPDAAPVIAQLSAK